MTTILIVDDKKDNLVSFLAILNEMNPGFRVITASSGKEGIERAVNEQPDVILLDIIMPKMDGYETCRRLKDDEQTKHIPVILITAIRTDSESRIRGLKIGADAFLSKPIDHSELAAQVNVMLRIRRAEQQLRKDLEISEGRFEKIFAHAPVGIEVYDQNGLLVNINQACLDIFGVSDINEVKRFKLFEDPNISAKIKKKLRKGEAVSYDMEFDFERVRKNKLYKTSRTGVIHLQLHITPYEVSSMGDIGYLVHVLDITAQKIADNELKKSQEHWRSLTESSPYHIMLLGLDGEIKFINRTFHDLAKEEVIGKNVLDFTPPDFHDETKACLDKVIQSLTYQEYQTEFITKEGKHKYLGVRLGPILEHGIVTSFISCFTDISTEIQAELQLKELVKERTSELEAKNEKLENFNSLFVGREFRIKELKDEVEQLEEKLKKREENL